ncbi:MAG: glycosyltransferase family 61 protein [Pelagibacterales bacterium]|nr:glycosyltransferase family 61 protein [Pelagibacterales bacterium]
MKILIQKFYFFIVKKIFDLIYFKLTIPKDDYYRRNVETFKFKINKNSKKKYNIYRIKNSRIYSDLSQHVAVIKDKFLIKNLSTQTIDNYLVDIKQNKILKTGTRKLIQKKVKGSVLSLVQGISGIENYGHWMLDIMPKLYISSKFKKLKQYDAIYFPNINKHFQKQSLLYLNLDNKRFIDGSKIRHLYADEIIIPQHPYWKKNIHQLKSVENIDRDFINWMRKKFLVNIKKRNKKKIIIDRSDSLFEHNQIQNKKFIYTILKKLKFEVIQLSKLSFKKQIEYFYNSSCIISPHGAGLTNIIFCKPNTKIIELNNSNFNCKVFRNLSKLNNLNYKIIKRKKFIKDFPGDINIPIHKLKRFIY